MSKKIILFIVVILGILIFLAFLALFYGIYLKISSPGKNLLDLPSVFSSNLLENEHIKNIEVINDNKLLILIEKDKTIKGAIYDINNNKIITYIEQ